jgi:hypothetical protein
MSGVTVGNERRYNSKRGRHYRFLETALTTALNPAPRQTNSSCVDKLDRQPVYCSDGSPDAMPPGRYTERSAVAGCELVMMACGCRGCSGRPKK